MGEYFCINFDCNCTVVVKKKIITQMLKPRETFPPSFFQCLCLSTSKTQYESILRVSSSYYAGLMVLKYFYKVKLLSCVTNIFGYCSAASHFTN